MSSTNCTFLTRHAWISRISWRLSASTGVMIRKRSCRDGVIVAALVVWKVTFVSMEQSNGITQTLIRRRDSKNELFHAHFVFWTCPRLILTSRRKFDPKLQKPIEECWEKTQLTVILTPLRKSRVRALARTVSRRVSEVRVRMS